MRKIIGTVFGFWLCGLLIAARADTLSLADGTSLTGDIIKSTDTGLMLHLSDNGYTNVLWTKFSQEAMKELAKNPKIKSFVEPFIEIPLSERPQKTELKIREVTRLKVPPKQSLIGALFSSSVGIFTLLLIYAANIYAGYEIAVVRIRPKALVMGVAAVLPVLGPIIFLALPMQVQAAPTETQAEVDPTSFAVPGQPVEQAEIHIAAGSWQPPSAAPVAGQVFKRGQFTFNRRFIETKFAAYFGEIHSTADESSVFIVKTAGGEFTIERIIRMAASEIYVAVAAGETRQEVMIPLADIQEIQINPKAA